mgnify:CR=1 FL=1
MLTMYIAWTLSMIVGSAITSRTVFKEFLEVKRHVAFREQFPNHPMTLMQSDEMVGAVYAKKKTQAVTRLQTLGMLTVWPLTVPYMMVMIGYDKVVGINDNMAPPLTIDYNRIREEEGRR